MPIHCDFHNLGFMSFDNTFWKTNHRENTVNIELESQSFTYAMVETPKMIGEINIDGWRSRGKKIKITQIMIILFNKSIK